MSHPPGKKSANAKVPRLVSDSRTNSSTLSISTKSHWWKFCPKASLQMMLAEKRTFLRLTDEVCVSSADFDIFLTNNALSSSLIDLKYFSFFHAKDLSPVLTKRSKTNVFKVVSKQANRSHFRSATMSLKL